MVFIALCVFNMDGIDKVKRFDKVRKTACMETVVGIKLLHNTLMTANRTMVWAVFLNK